MVLKPNMVISGMKAAKRAGVEEVAERTVKILKRCVPSAVPASRSCLADSRTKKRPRI